MRKSKRTESTDNIKNEDYKPQKKVNPVDENFFQAMFESHQAVMLLIDPFSGAIIDANKAAVKFYKYLKEELMQLKIQDINQLDPDEVRAEWMKALNDVRNYFVFPHKLADGQIRWVEVYSSSFVFKEKPLLFSIIHDITERKEAEEALKKSEEKFENAFKSNPNAIILSRLEDGKIFDVNETFYSLTGLKREEVIGKKSVDIDFYVFPSDRDKLVQQLHEEGKIRNLELNIKHRSGKILNVLLSTEKLETDKNNTILTIIQDISEQKQLQNQHKKQNELFQTIFDTVPAMISIYDPEIQNIQLNREFERVTGWTQQQTKEKNTMELVYPDPEYRQEVADYMQSLQPGFKEIIMTGKDGSKIESLWANVAMADGRRVGIGIDIRQQKKAEEERERLLKQLAREKEALVESELKYRTMGEAANYGVWAANAEGKITYLSKSFCNMTGKSYLELKEFGWIEILVPEQSREVIDHWIQSVKNGTPYEHEYQIIDKYGEKRHVLARAKPIRNKEGEITSWAGIHLDITDRKKVNEQLAEQNMNLTRMNRILEDFVYIAAHDLRSPIGNLLTINDLISNHAYLEKKMELFHMLGPVTKKLQQTVDGLLEMVTLQTEEQLNAEVVEFEKIWQEVSEVLAPEISVFTGTLKVEFTEAPAIRYVKVHLISIIKNLVSNAVKYSSKSEHPQVHVKTIKKGDFILLVVHDNGIGIDLEKAGDNLFKPFRRFTKKADGIGMGLYIVKNIIEKNGGNIQVQSKPDKGSSFYCYIKEYPIESTT